MGAFEIAKSLLDLANSLFGLSKVYASEEREYRDRLSTHLAGLSACLERIADGPSHSDCGELDGHLEALRGQLEGVIATDRIDRFDVLLQNSVKARTLLAGEYDQVTADTLRSASGRFRALSSEVRTA